MIKKEKLNRVFGTVLLLMAVLVVWHWGLVDVQNQILWIWIIVDIIFIALPIIYLLGYGYLRGKSFNGKNINWFVFILLLITGLVALYQVLMGRAGVQHVLWEYLNAFCVVTYSLIAGKHLL